MFGYRSFLDKEIEAWHVECWAWLIKYGADGGLKAFQETELVLPTPDYFPGTDEAGHAKAQHVFNQVRDLAGMSKWPVKLEEHFVPPAALNEIAFVDHGDRQCAGTFSYSDDNQGVITYDSTLVNRPISLIATFAHELGHYLNSGFQAPPPDGWDLIEPATDVTATFMGFGLFGANSSCDDFMEYSEDGIPQVRRGKSGYHTEAQWIFDLAIFCVLTQTDPEVAQAHLKPHLWKQLKKAIKHAERREIGGAVLSLL